MKLETKCMMCMVEGGYTYEKKSDTFFLPHFIFYIGPNPPKTMHIMHFVFRFVWLYSDARCTLGALFGVRPCT